MNSGTEFSQFQKIEILLHEYDTLRDEIGGRTRDGFNMFAITSALFVGALSLLYGKAGTVVVVIVGILGAIAFAVAARETFYRIARAAERLREIEGDVNERVGEKLLVWETQWGAATRGWFLEAWRGRTSTNH